MNPTILARFLVVLASAAQAVTAPASEGLHARVPAGQVADKEAGSQKTAASCHEKWQRWVAAHKVKNQAPASKNPARAIAGARDLVEEADVALEAEAEAGADGVDARALPGALAPGQKTRRALNDLFIVHTAGPALDPNLGLNLDQLAGCGSLFLFGEHIQMADELQPGQELQVAGQLAQIAKDNGATIQAIVTAPFKKLKLIIRVLRAMMPGIQVQEHGF